MVLKVLWKCLGWQRTHKNGLKLKKWTQILKIPTIPSLASQALEPESLTPDQRPLLLLLLLLLCVCVFWRSGGGSVFSTGCGPPCTH